MMVVPEKRIHRHILECIVHESHVPLEHETKTAVIGRPCNHRVRS